MPHGGKCLTIHNIGFNTNRHKGSERQFSVTVTRWSLSTQLLYQVPQKSNPLKLFAVFSATAWNFSVRCDYPIYAAKQHLTVLKYNEVIDILVSSHHITSYHIT